MRASHSLRTPENADSPQITTTFIDADKESRKRLEKVAKILHKKKKGHEFKAQMIYQLYKAEGADFLSDLMTSKGFIMKNSAMISESGDKNLLANGRNEFVKNSIWKMIPTSLNTQVITLDLLISNALKYNLKFTCELLLQIFELPSIPACDYPILEVQEIHKKLLSKTALDSSTLEKLRATLCDFCIQLSMGFGRPLISALFLNRCMEHSIYIHPSTIEQVLISLSVTHSLLGNYQYYTLIKLLNKLEVKTILDAPLYLRLISNMCKSGGFPFFANMILHRAIELNSFLHDKSHFNLSALKDLTWLNIDNGNIQKALEIWKFCYDLDSEFPYENKLLFRKLFISCKMSDKAELLTKHFPEDLLTHNDLFDIILTFFGLHPDFNNDFIELSKFVAPPISRPLLSSLLISFLGRSSRKEVSLLTKAIINSQGGLMPLDVDALVKHCLKNSEFSEALQIVLRNKISATKLGYVRLTEYVLNKALDGFVVKLDPNDPLHETIRIHVTKELPDVFNDQVEHSPQIKNTFGLPRLQNDLILNFITTEFIKLGNDPVFNELTLVLLKYLCRKDGCAIGRRFFMRSKKRNYPAGFSFDFVKFGLPKNFINLVKIDESNRIRCLEVILEHAKSENDVSSIEWCIAEFRRAGLLVEDIIKEYFSERTNEANS